MADFPSRMAVFPCANGADAAASLEEVELNTVQENLMRFAQQECLTQRQIGRGPDNASLD
eukprot:792879-Amorphochlora_amoeboformis.AAC.1